MLSNDLRGSMSVLLCEEALFVIYGTTASKISKSKLAMVGYFERLKELSQKASMHVLKP